MFTGLIQDVGTITAMRKTARDATLTIRAKNLRMDTLKLGASVCCNGICLTVLSKTKDSFTVAASNETLIRTTLGAWTKGAPVNLERSLRLGDELGGHLVFGHVDAVAQCTGVKREGESYRFSFKINKKWLRFIAPKGSIAINGVSLTVNEVKGDSFGVNIIPITLKKTGFGKLAKGEQVNIEIDMLARYVANLKGVRL